MTLRSTGQLRTLWAPPCTGPFVQVTLFGGGRVSVRPAIVDAVHALDACLRAADYPTHVADTGAYNCRHITGGTGYSLHSYGIALDLNWATNPYGPRLHTDMPPAMVAAIQGIRTNSGAQVWRWGGTYSGNKDAMHYEVVASPAEIASGINPHTFPGTHPPQTVHPTTFKLAMLTIVRTHSKLPPATAAGWAEDIREFQLMYDAAFHPKPPLAVGPEDTRTDAAIGWCVGAILKS